MIAGSVALALTTAVGFSSVAVAQQPGPVVVDDPTGALGDDRAAVDAAATEFAAEGAGFVVSVVPSTDGRDDDALIADRFAALLPTGGTVDPMLVVILDEERVIAGVRTEAGATVLADQLEATSEAASDAFESGDAGAAAVTGIEELHRQLVDFEPGGDDDSSGFEWKGILAWAIPVLLIFGVVCLFRALRSRPLRSILERGVTPVGELRPGTAVVSGVAMMTEPLISPFGQVPCIYWRTSWTEEKQSSWTERGTRPVQAGERYNEDGTTELVYRDQEYEVEHVKTTTKKHTDDSLPVAFVLRDETGMVVVDPPKRARMEGAMTLKTDTAYEAAIPVDSTVTVVGPVELDDGRPQLQWPGRGRPSSRRPFVVTTGGFTDFARDVRSTVRGNLALAVACLVGIVVVLVVVAS